MPFIQWLGDISSDPYETRRAYGCRMEKKNDSYRSKKIPNGLYL